MLPADGSQDAYIKAVSILTRAEARVLLFVLVLRSNRFMFQSSPAPRRGCCRHVRADVPKPERVSILTRAEARVLPTL